MKPFIHTGKTPPKKILLLSVSAGAGHVRAAEAIKAAALAHGTGPAVCHLDVMDFVPANFRKVYSDFYASQVSKHPLLWRCIYQISNDAKPNGLMQRFRRLVERINIRKLLREIKAQVPDAIICTHFLPAEILSSAIRKESIAAPVWVQVTDYDLHRMWVVPSMTGYFVANEEVSYRLKAHGIPGNQVHITGIPIMPTFGTKLLRAECATEFQLDPSRRTVLLMGGGAGMGPLDTIAEHLLSMGSDFQLIVLAGGNLPLLKTLRQLSKRFPGQLFPQGYTDKIERLMACADFAITKPGGLTTSECLAVGLPMVVNSPIPGQEERNADFLLEQGAVMKAYDQVSLEYRVRHLLANPKKLALMQSNAHAISRPRAAQDVVEIVLSHSSS